MIHRMDAAPADFEPMPELVRPMLAEPGALPTNDDGWSYEFKWDGLRAVLYVEGGRVRILTRNDHDVSDSYPELREIGERLGSTQAVLDGEIVALDDEGRPSFEALQRRMHVADSSRARRLADEVPVTFLAFDVLYVDGHLLLSATYDERRKVLAALSLDGPRSPSPLRSTALTAPMCSTRLESEGSKAWWPSAATALPAWAPVGRVGQGQEFHDPRGGDRGLHGGQGPTE